MNYYGLLYAVYIFFSVKDEDSTLNINIYKCLNMPSSQALSFLFDPPECANDKSQVVGLEQGLPTFLLPCTPSAF